ncbi:MAG: hypothetical protein Tsb006_1450 [Rickettsiaceae bacterium]
MRLSEDDLKLIKDNDCQFISLKYLGEDGMLKQLDTYANTVVNSKQHFFNHNDIKLSAIKNKAFLDPFRSAPTASFFCENMSDRAHHHRRIADDIYKASRQSEEHKVSAEISFWFAEGNCNNSSLFASDPKDQHANLRSDIMSTLEDIGIQTTVHYHGEEDLQSVIGIKGSTVIDLADNLVISKFIIANCSASYGLNAYFTLPGKTNINLCLAVEQADIEEKYSRLMARGIKALSFATQLPEYKFEVKKISKYMTTEQVALNVGLETTNHFIPYFALLEFLAHGVDSEAINKYLASLF